MSNFEEMMECLAAAKRHGIISESEAKVRMDKILADLAGGSARERASEETQPANARMQHSQKQ